MYTLTGQKNKNYLKLSFRFLDLCNILEEMLSSCRYYILKPLPADTDEARLIMQQNMLIDLKFSQ